MAKKSKKNLSLVLFVIGIALILWGVNENGMFGNRLVRGLSGGLSDRVMILWIAGGALALFGGLGLFKK